MNYDFIFWMKVVVTGIVSVGFIMNACLHFKAILDCGSDLKLIRKSMSDNNKNKEITDRGPDSDFRKCQIRNAEYLKEAYLTRLSFAKEFSLAMLKYGATIGAIWLNLNLNVGN